VNKWRSTIGRAASTRTGKASGTLPGRRLLAPCPERAALGPSQGCASGRANAQDESGNMKGTFLKSVDNAFLRRLTTFEPRGTVKGAVLFAKHAPRFAE
jgi:hypothetical protein